MSGGYFQYEQYKIQYIADSIQTLIDNNDSQERNEWGGAKLGADIRLKSLTSLRRLFTPCAWLRYTLTALIGL